MDAPVPFTRPTPAVADVASRVRTTRGSRFVLGSGDGHRRTYRLRGGASLAASLLDGAPPSTGWPELLAELGALLAGLHGTPSGGDRAAPPAAYRLSAWLAADGSPPDPGRGRDDFLHALPTATLETLRSGARRTLTPSVSVLNHGWLSFGQCIPSGDGTLEVLLGEDLGHAPRAYDLGTVLAGVMELGAFAPGARRHLDLATAKAALLDGYGTAVTVDDVHEHAVLALVRHVADFTAYGRYHPAEPARWARLVVAVTGGDRP